MPRTTPINLTLFTCSCGRALALLHLPSVTRPITLTCPDCGGETRIGPERSRDVDARGRIKGPAVSTIDAPY